MKIRIIEKNATAIEAALKKANGRATAFTVTDYATVAKVASRVEQDIVRATGAKKYLPGCVVRFRSGYRVASAYKHRRIVTILTITFTKSGAFLTGVDTDEIFPNQGESRIVELTEEAEDAVCDRVLRGLSY